MYGNYSLQGKMQGVKSVISKASNAKADLLVGHDDKIYFGNLFLEVRSIVIFSHCSSEHNTENTHFQCFCLLIGHR